MLGFFIFVVLGLAAIILLVIYLLGIKKQEDIIASNSNDPDRRSVFNKKYPEVNIERYRSTLVLFGMVLTLAIVTLAFSWSKGDLTAASLGEANPDDDIEIEPPQTKQEKPPPPPPPPPKLDIVEDEEEIEEEPEIEDMDADEETEVQEIEEEEFNDEEVFMIVEDMPKFPGGDAQLQVYLAKTPYPPIARENGIEGNVWVSFVVDKSGNIINAKIARGADPALDKAALNRVKSMPKWSPGKQRGKPVKVSYNVKIGFKLM